MMVKSKFRGFVSSELVSVPNTREIRYGHSESNLSFSVQVSNVAAVVVREVKELPSGQCESCPKDLAKGTSPGLKRCFRSQNILWQAEADFRGSIIFKDQVTPRRDNLKT